MARATHRRAERQRHEQAAVHRRANKGRWKVRALRPQSRNWETWGTFDTEPQARDELVRTACDHRDVRFELEQI